MMKHTKIKIFGLFLGVWIVIITGFNAFVHASDDFRDMMTLSEALDVALSKNPAVGTVMAQREAAEARVWEVRSDFFPQANISAGYTRYKEPNIIIPIHKRGVFPPLDDQIYEGIAQVRVPLFNGGRTLAANRAAQATVNESSALEELTKTNLMEKIAQIYIFQRELEDKKAIISARLKVLKRRYSELSLLHKEGRVSSADLSLGESVIESAQSDSVGIESRNQDLSLRLGQLLGLDAPVQPIISSVDSSAEKVSIPDFDENEQTINGPEVRKAQAQLVRNEALHSLAKRTYWPEISGFASYFLRSGRDRNPIGEWAAGFSIRLPLFEGGRRAAEIHAARASVEAAREQSRATVNEQNTNLKIIIHQWKTSERQRQYLQRAVESKSRSVLAQREIYDAGRISLSELLTQETELLQLQIEERGVAYSELLAMIRYHATAGTLSVNLITNIVRSAL